MDVTTRNFRAALTLLRHHLPRASFVAFDLEFTGLGDCIPSHLDTPAVRYTRARQDADDFVPIQFGLTLFHVQASSSRVMPFNFNLAPGAVYYPPAARYPIIDRRFVLQGSAVAFLTHHGFDFEKCLTLGVSWLDKDLEKRLSGHVEADMRRRRSRHVRSADPSKKRHPTGGNSGDDDNNSESNNQMQEEISISNNDNDREAREACERDTKRQKRDHDSRKGHPELLANLSCAIEAFIEHGDAHTNIPDRQVKLLPLPRAPIERGAVFHHIRTQYARISATSLSTPHGKRLRLQLYKNVAEADAQRQEELLNDVDDIVTHAVGFRYVIDLLCEARVPLVVHHGLMDMTKLYASFVGPLPPTLPDFKRVFREAFPVVHDTRVLTEHLFANDSVIRDAASGKGRDLSDIVDALRIVAVSRGVHVQFDTYVPCGRVRDTGRLAQSEMTSEEHLIVKEGEECDPESDAYGFSRYVDCGSAHEAGYDSLQTGLLFSVLQSFVGQNEEAKKQLKTLEGKVFLSSCGGYKWIDFGSAADEENAWFDKDVIIVSSIKAGPRVAKNARSTLKTILQSSHFDAEKSEIIPAGRESFIAILARKPSTEATSIGLLELLAAENEGGPTVHRYAPSALGKRNHKRQLLELALD